MSSCWSMASWVVSRKTRSNNISYLWDMRQSTKVQFQHFWWSNPQNETFECHEFQTSERAIFLMSHSYWNGHEFRDETITRSIRLWSPRYLHILVPFQRIPVPDSRGTPLISTKCTKRNVVDNTGRATWKCRVHWDQSPRCPLPQWFPQWIPNNMRLESFPPISKPLKSQKHQNDKFQFESKTKKSQSLFDGLFSECSGNTKWWIPFHFRLNPKQKKMHSLSNGFFVPRTCSRNIPGTQNEKFQTESKTKKLQSLSNEFFVDTVFSEYVENTCNLTIFSNFSLFQNLKNEFKNHKQQTPGYKSFWLFWGHHDAPSLGLAVSPALKSKMMSSIIL